MAPRYFGKPDRLLEGGLISEKGGVLIWRVLSGVLSSFAVEIFWQKQSRSLGDHSWSRSSRLFRWVKAVPVGETLMWREAVACVCG